MFSMGGEGGGIVQTVNLHMHYRILGVTLSTQSKYLGVILELELLG